MSFQSTFFRGNRDYIITLISFWFPRPTFTWFPMSLFGVGTIHRDLNKPQVYHGNCRSIFDSVFFPLFSCLLFGIMFKPETQTFEFKSLEGKVSELLTGGRRSFFFWYLGYLGISSQKFQKLFDSAIFLCNCVVWACYNVSFLAGVWGPLFTWWQWQLAAVRLKKRHCG